VAPIDRQMTGRKPNAHQQAFWSRVGLLLSGVHLFDDRKVHYLAARQMQLSTSSTVHV